MKKIIALLSTALLIPGLSACQTQPVAIVPQSMLRAQASARVVYHVVPESKAGVWHVKLQKNPQPLATFRTKEEAVDAGRAMAKAQALGQLIVYKANGQIETEYTYGKDPNTSLG